MNEVALKESPRFCGNSISPLKPALLENRRCLRNFSGMKRKRGTDAKVDARRKPILVVGDPVFLLGATESDPNQIRSGLDNFLKDSIILIRWPFSKWWRIDTCNFDLRMISGQILMKLMQGAFLAA